MKLLPFNWFSVVIKGVLANPVWLPLVFPKYICHPRRGTVLDLHSFYFIIYHTYVSADADNS